jgi:hypothetical protein
MEPMITTYVVEKENVGRISTDQAHHLQKGDVVLVRSEGVPQYGDHYIVVTGGIVSKPHGLRPETETIQLYPHTDASLLLDEYKPYNGVVALKLKKEAAKKFLDIHGIEIVDGEVKFLSTY